MNTSFQRAISIRGLFTTGFLLAVMGFINPAEAQKASRVYGGEHPLVNINDVALYGETAFVLTAAAPSVHVFADKSYKSWGIEGKGPGELRRPLAIEVANNSVFVLDAPPGACKVVSYSLQGKYLSSEAVRGVQMCYDLKVSGDYKILHIGKWMQRKKELILFDESPDTLISYKEPEPVRIEPEEGPVNSYNLVTPFTPQPQWTTNSKGALIFWDGNNSVLSILDVKTGEKEFLNVPPHNHSVQPADIDAWINEKFSPNQSLFGHHDPFRSIRENIRKKVTFPDRYPLLSKIKADPNGGVWVLRAAKFSGEIWTYVTSNGGQATIQFPENREVIVFGKEFIVAKTKDENGIEYVELYKRDEFIEHRR